MYVCAVSWVLQCVALYSCSAALSRFFRSIAFNDTAGMVAMETQRSSSNKIWPDVGKLFFRSESELPFGKNTAITPTAQLSVLYCGCLLGQLSTYTQEPRPFEHVM